MNMLSDRNRTSYSYDEETAEAILANIFDLSLCRKLDSQDLLGHIERVGQVFYK